MPVLYFVQWPNLHLLTLYGDEGKKKTKKTKQQPPQFLISFRKKVELKKNSSKHILKGALTPSLARKQLRKEESVNSLYKTRSCSSLDSENNKTNTQNNYLTVHVSIVIFMQFFVKKKIGKSNLHVNFRVSQL